MSTSDILVVQTGIGPARATEVMTQLLKDQAWDLVISAGFAGGLGDLPVGMVLIGREVQDESLDECAHSSPVACDPVWVQRAHTIATQCQQKAKVVRFVSVPRILTSGQEKRELRMATGADAVDMESLAIGEVAANYHVPFLVIRSISDTVNEDLPIDFNRFLRPYGWVGGVGRVLMSPTSWKGFVRLSRQSQRAAYSISEFFSSFFSTLEHVECRQGIGAEGS